MRKRVLFAFGMCVALLLAQVSLTPAAQAQTSGAQSSPPQTSGQQGTQTSAQPTATRPNRRQTGQQTTTHHSQRTAQQSATRQNQPAVKQAAGQDGAALRQNPQTGQQGSTHQSHMAGQPSATGQIHPTGKQAASQRTQAPRPPAIPPGYRLLSLKEGRTIVQEMSWADDEEGLSPDCSHLVHKLYEQSGHPYPYASSLDLYRGTGPFLRVRYAHPGDLVVWRGHVGIVMNPREHSFFSTTSSGARAENYRSPYWRARGYPHFFRYLTKSPLQASASHDNQGTTAAANQQPQH